MTLRSSNQLPEVRLKLDAMAAQFAAVLPRHITPAKFVRVVLTAIQNNPELLECDRHSLFNACMRAATDGLLPDGRLGAIVTYKDRKRGVLQVRAAHSEPDITDDAVVALAAELGELAEWLDLDDVEVDKRGDLATALRKGDYPPHMKDRPVYYLHRFDPAWGFITEARIVGIGSSAASNS